MKWKENCHNYCLRSPASPSGWSQEPERIPDAEALNIAAFGEHEARPRRSRDQRVVGIAEENRARTRRIAMIVPRDFGPMIPQQDREPVQSILCQRRHR